MRCWNQVVFWSPTRELASGFPTPLEMRVFFLFGILMGLTSSAISQLMCVLHPLRKNVHPLRKDLHWVNSSINRQSNSFQECSIWNYWSHGCKMCITLSYKFWKVFVMACRHSIFAFKDYFKSLVWLLEVVGQKPCIRDISRRLIFHLCVLFGLWTKMTTQWCQILMNMGEEQQFNGLLDVYKKTFATNSIAGLYRGFFWSLVLVTLCAVLASSNT